MSVMLVLPVLLGVAAETIFFRRLLRRRARAELGGTRPRGFRQAGALRETTCSERNRGGGRGQSCWWWRSWWRCRRWRG